MGEWKEYKLGEISNYLNRGVSPSYVESDGYTILNQKCIRNGKIDFLLSKRTSAQKKYSKEKLLQEGDILINSTGVGTAGRVAIFMKDVTCYADTHISIVRIDKDFVHSKFIFYNLFRREDEIENYAEGSTGQIELGRDKIKDIDILLPTLPEQTAIASILSSLDDKIDLLHRQNATLEKMAETLFRQWFVEEAKEEWDEINFGEFVTPKKGKNITKSEVVEGSYPVVAGGLEPSCYHIEANTKSPVITISASGANAGYIRLYTTPVWSSDSSYIDESITPYVYFCYVFLKINQSKLTDKQEGSAQPHIYPSHIMELDFMSYPESIIKVFEESARPLFNKIKSNQTQIRTLTALRDTLLPKLMSGEVRVEPD